MAMRGSILIDKIDRNKTYYKYKFSEEDVKEQPSLEGKIFLLLPYSDSNKKIYWYMNYEEYIEVYGEMYIGTNEAIDDQIKRFKNELGNNKIQYLGLKK